MLDRVDLEALERISERLARSVKHARQWGLTMRDAALDGDPHAAQRRIDKLLEQLTLAQEAVTELRAELEAESDFVTEESLIETRRPPLVMVVDDDAAIREQVADILEGYEVVLFPDGEDAIAAIRAGNWFDLVLCDVVMEGATGVELYQYIRENRPALAQRFVFLTAGEFSPLMREIVGALEDEILVLHKPIQGRILRWVVEERTRHLAG